MSFGTYSRVVAERVNFRKDPVVAELLAQAWMALVREGPFFRHPEDDDDREGNSARKL